LGAQPLQKLWHVITLPQPLEHSAYQFSAFRSQDDEPLELPLLLLLVAVNLQSATGVCGESHLPLDLGMHEHPVEGWPVPGHPGSAQHTVPLNAAVEHSMGAVAGAGPLR
jgi:hypothetical protein